MNRFLLLIVLLCASSVAYGQSVTDRKLDAKIETNIANIESLSGRVDSLGGVVQRGVTDIECVAKRVEVVDDCYSKHNDLLAATNSAISSEISAGSWAVSIVSLILAVAGIVLGSYVSRKEEQIKSLAEQVRKKEQEVSELSEKVNSQRNEVVELNRQIQKDMSGLYAQLRREETISMLDRLIEVPEDIGNLNTQLSSRVLIDEDYDRLLRAYNQLVANGDNNVICGVFQDTYGSAYMVLFFQHFSGRIINESSVNLDLKSYFEDACHCAFRNDMEKSTHDLLQGIASWAEDKRIDILSIFASAAVEFPKDSRFVYDIIIAELNDKDLVVKVWQKLIDSKSVVMNFAAAIKSFYVDLAERIDADVASVTSVAKQ